MLYTAESGSFDGECDTINHLASSVDIDRWLQCPRWQPETWMRDIFPLIRNLAITEIRCVGTHNSGTYGITDDSNIAPDAPGLLSGTGCLSSFTRFVAHGIAVSWAICQHKTVLQQLEMGVRYLDLRVVPHATSGELMTTHSLYGAKLSDIINDIVTFLDRPTSSHEFLIVDFQHIFCSEEYMANMFFPQLEPLLDRCVFRDCGLQKPLESLLAMNHKRRIFFFLGCEFDHEQHIEVFPRSLYLESDWKNAESPKFLFDELEKDTSTVLDEVKSAQSSGSWRFDPPSKVVVTQAIITPVLSSILKNTLSSCCCTSCCCCCCCCSGTFMPLEHIALEFNTKAIGWFSHWNSQVDEENIAIPRGCGVHRNVLLLDFPEHGALQLRWNNIDVMFDAVGWCVFLNVLYKPLLEGASP